MKHGDVTLDARSRILGRDGDELAFRRSTLIEAAAGSGYEPMVAATARALESSPLGYVPFPIGCSTQRPTNNTS